MRPANVGSPAGDSLPCLPASVQAVAGTSNAGRVMAARKEGVEADANGRIQLSPNQANHPPAAQTQEHALRIEIF